MTTSIVLLVVVVLLLVFIMIACRQHSSNDKKGGKGHKADSRTDKNKQMSVSTRGRGGIDGNSETRNEKRYTVEEDVLIGSYESSRSGNDTVHRRQIRDSK